ncbi:uncharacterized protein LOC128244660 [Mya arenaria]|uniref:uncharacterized protein LOC128244660 n=1 Tax=Mya arenaria TaxID=6604 RepID=UPI0022E87EDF|nr:uncharacterized protein LOC128244660 [Mya arenaria]
MGCSNRPYFWPVMSLVVVALSFQLFAYVYPGWIMMRRDVTQYCRKGTINEEVDMMKEEIFGAPAPPPGTGDKQDPEMNEPRVPEELTEEKKPEEEWVEEQEFKQWFNGVIVDIKKIDFALHFGLFHARVCVREKESETVIIGEMGKEEIDTLEEKADEPTMMARRSASSDSHDSDSKEHHDGKHGDDKHHKKCHCKKLSINCALKNAWVFEDPANYYNLGGRKNEVLSKHNYGYASLSEHRAEVSIAVIFNFLGLISAIGAFRKNPGCKYSAVVCVVFLLIAAFFTIAPVSRFAHYSVNKHHMRLPVNVSPPVCAIASGLGAILAVIAAFVAFIGAMSSIRKQRSGRWYQFNNELELPAELEKEKSPKLVFINDPLPPKPGFEDQGNM